MAGGSEEWFFGDATPAAGARALAPHFCPGYRVATVLLETMSAMLFALPDLRADDDSGLTFSYDWPTLKARLDLAARG
jgi:hypothetical protein